VYWQYPLHLRFSSRRTRILSDVVTFTNVGGIATAAFFSDTDGTPLLAQGLPIRGQFTESNKPVSVFVALVNGQFVNAKVCRDLAESLELFRFE
jgi:hypothetical protein